MTNALEVAHDAAERGLALFCTTVSPAETLEARALFAKQPNIRVGIGLHPWWVTGGTDDTSRIAQAVELAAQSDYIGEIGLDFSPAHEHTRTAQLSAFEQIAAACATHPRPKRVLSIHAVRAANDALDILDRNDVAGSATCIFHWFSGTSDDFARLRRLGCLISVNERMLATRRGREYARQIPLGQLLIETDAPAQLDTPGSATELEASLRRVIDTLAELRHTESLELARTIARTSSRLLQLM